jgi:hypothetical protein
MAAADPGGLWASVSDLDKPTSPNGVEALQAASYMLWVLSGRRWSGVRTVTEEYVCDRTGYRSALEVQALRAAEDHLRTVFRDELWGREAGQSVLFLRNRPVRELVSMRRMDGDPVDVSLYAVYDHAFIAPVSGGCCDPCFDPCCLEVTYTWGTPPPPMGRLAAIELANEFVKSVECPDQCTLPERITSISRQGVNMQVFDSQDFLTDGRMGVYTVDVFLKAVNPYKAQKRPRVFSPDIPAARRRTWPGGTGSYGWGGRG